LQQYEVRTGFDEDLSVGSKVVRGADDVNITPEL
jgi:hypothetical protein